MPYVQSLDDIQHPRVRATTEFVADAIVKFMAFNDNTGVAGILTITDGVVGMQAFPTGGYTLPIATDAVLGGVKVGSGLAINGATGVLSATEPIFTAHAAFNVTNQQISDWNTAFGWGSHAGLYAPVGRTISINGVVQDLSANRSWVVSAGEETDPVFSGSPAGAITGQMIADWNTAFGWGSHAGLYVPLGRTLTINGETYDLSANRTWTVDVGGGFVPTVELSGAVTSYNIVATSGWFTLICNGADSITVNLPSASGHTGIITIKSFLSVLTNKVTVDGLGGELIDGATTAVMPARDSITLVPKNGAWYII